MEESQHVGAKQIYRLYKKEWCAFKSEQEIYFSPYTVKRTPSAATTVEVSHSLPAVRFSRLLRGRGASFQDGVAAGKGFLCAPF